MKKILIALDYEPVSREIAASGHALAKSMEATAILLHVSDAPAYAYPDYSPIMGINGFGSITRAQNSNADNSKKMAREYLDKLRKHLNDESIETVVRNGDLAETIVDTAVELGADMIVIGTHNRKGLEKLLMGSVAKDVLARSPIPVLTISSKAIEHQNNEVSESTGEHK